MSTYSPAAEQPGFTNPLAKYMNQPPSSGRDNQFGSQPFASMQTRQQKKDFDEFRTTVDSSHGFSGTQQVS